MIMLARAAFRLPAFLRVPLIACLLLARSASPAYAQPVSVAIGIATQAKSAAAANAVALGTTQSRLQWWARSYTGLRAIRTMAAPPTVTRTNSGTSSVNSGVVNGSGTGLTLPNSAKLTIGGITGLALDGSNWATLQGTSNTAGVKGTAAAVRIRLMTDAPTFEVAYVEGQGSFVNAIVDGEWVSRANDGTLPAAANTGNVRYTKFDFGADSVSDELASIGAQTAAGSGYVAGEVIQVVGGTYTRPAKLRVYNASSGASTGLAIEDAGSYSVKPTGTLATTSLTGSGTGVTLTAAFWAPRHTTRKLRQIEIVGQFVGKFIGIVTTSADTIVAWPFNPRVPKLLVVGDSQNAGTYLEYGGGQAGVSLAERLGLRDNLVINALGGTGWVVVNGTSGAFGNSYRVADYIAAAPDVIVFDGSQNDGTVNNAAVTTAVGSVLNQLLAALPNVRIVLIGPVWGGQTSYTAALASGVALATDQSRVRLVDNVAEGWLAGSSNSYGTTAAYATSDSTHIGQYGLDEFRSRIVAERVASKLLEMIP